MQQRGGLARDWRRDPLTVDRCCEQNEDGDEQQEDDDTYDNEGRPERGGDQPSFITGSEISARPDPSTGTAGGSSKAALQNLKKFDFLLYEHRQITNFKQTCARPQIS